MHADLEVLLEIQDLKSQQKELGDASGGRQVEEEVFHVSIEEAVAQLGEKADEMVASLSPAVRARYQRIAGRYPRVVAPVIGGTCYGCFVSIPTMVSSGPSKNAQITNCENCGRFLYHVG
jgi:predicted  nucleic acid-binding Zn-ribbon protein